MNQKSSFLSRFTPSLMPPEALEGIFVQRHELARQILERIRESVTTRCQHHTLVFGPRGIGKTHLISLLYYRLQGMSELRDHLRLAWLREEEWEVTSFLDFLLRTLQVLSEDGGGDAALSERLQSLYNLPPERAELGATAALVDFLLNRALLILMENLDELLQRMAPDGRLRFRRFLKDHPSCMLLASSQVPLEEVLGASQPLPGSCSVHTLEELTHEDAMRLLAKIADYRGDGELSAFLSTARGKVRMRALKYLAGGNHRAYVIFSQFLSRESLEELIEPLMRTIDDLTPYYQSRMAWLSPEQRKIIAIICEYRHAVPIKEVARRCFMKQETASALLTALCKKGCLHSFSVGTDRYYELREPLMRLSIEVKKHRGKPLRMLVDFLRLWYSPAELQQRLTSLPADAIMERSYALPALQSGGEDSGHPRIPVCCAEYQSAVEQKDYERALQAAEELVSLRSRAEDLSARCFCLQNLGRYEEAAECYETLVAISPQDALAWSRRSAVLLRLGRHDEALRSCERAIEIHPDTAGFWGDHGVILLGAGQPDRALASFERALQLDAGDPTSWIRRGMALSELACYEEASASFARSSELDPGSELAYVYNCAALIELKRCERALPLAQRALEINPAQPLAWAVLGTAQAGVNRYREALVSVERAIELGERTSFVLFKRAEILLAADRWREGISALDAALSRFYSPENPDAGNTAAFVRSLQQSLDDEAGLRLRMKILVLIHKKHDALPALAHALVDCIPDLLTPVFQNAAAPRWLAMWRELAASTQEFKLPLRLLDSAVAFAESRDLRFLMELPLEERVLLEPLLGIQIQATA